MRRSLTANERPFDSQSAELLCAATDSKASDDGGRVVVDLLEERRVGDGTFSVRLRVRAGHKNWLQSRNRRRKVSEPRKNSRADFINDFNSVTK